MIARIAVIVFALLMSVGMAGAQGAYSIKEGDTLAVEVLEDSSLNRQALVLPGGNITFPLAGSVRAAGLSAEQLERSIASRIASNFSVAPTVYVSVVGLSAPAQADLTGSQNTIYLLGEFNNPGPIAIEPGTTALQALALGGGFTRFAATKRVQLRRKDASGRQRLYTINFKAIARGAEISGDPTLADGDVILVPERRLFE
jgi:polysaccharide export outer membrane protein